MVEISAIFRGVRDDLTVAEWLQKYIAGLTAVADTTVYQYGLYVAGLPDEWASAPLTGLTHADYGRWIQHMERKGAAPKTIQIHHAFLRSALEAACRARLITANPAANHRLPRLLRPSARRVLTPAEFGLLTEQFKPRWRPLLRFLVTSGCRWSEATALTPADVDRDLGEVNIIRAWTYVPGRGFELGQTKTAWSTRLINVHPDVLAELDYSHEYLFTSTRGNPLQMQGFHKHVWKPAVARAGLEFTPTVHCLRHTCATWMVRAGVPFDQVRDHLGHRSVAMTIDTYGHVDRAQLQAAAQKIHDILPKP